MMYVYANNVANNWKSIKLIAMRPAITDEIEALPFWDQRLKLFFIDENDELMEQAKLLQHESTIKNHPIGCVAVKDGKIVATASNQATIINPLVVKWHATWLCVRRWLRIPTGKHYWLCPGCAQPRNHAEARIARELEQKQVGGATVYLYGHFWCCEPCSESMLKARVLSVVLPEGAKAKFGR